MERWHEREENEDERGQTWSGRDVSPPNGSKGSSGRTHLKVSTQRKTGKDYSHSLQNLNVGVAAVEGTL